MKLNRYINMLILFPLIGVAIICLLLYYTTIIPGISNDGDTIVFMATIFIGTLLIITSVFSLVSKFILDKLNREKVFVTSLSVEECLKRSKLVANGGTGVKFISEDNNEMIFRTFLSGPVFPPNTVQLGFQSSDDKTIIRCKEKGYSFTIVNSIVFCFFGLIVCATLLIVLSQTFAGMNLSPPTYVGALGSCAVFVCVCFPFYGQIARTWKEYRGFINDEFQAKEVVDKQRFIRQFF